MANMRTVNKAIKAAYPEMDITAIRGRDYVYFIGRDGFDKIPSVMCSGNTPTEYVVSFCLEDIAAAVKAAAVDA